MYAKIKTLLFLVTLSLTNLAFGKNLDCQKSDNWNALMKEYQDFINDTFENQNELQLLENYSSKFIVPIFSLNSLQEKIHSLEKELKHAQKTGKKEQIEKLQTKHRKMTNKLEEQAKNLMLQIEKTEKVFSTKLKYENNSLINTTTNKVVLRLQKFYEPQTFAEISAFENLGNEFLFRKTPGKVSTESFLKSLNKASALNYLLWNKSGKISQSINADIFVNKDVQREKAVRSFILENHSLWNTLTKPLQKNIIDGPYFYNIFERMVSELKNIKNPFCQIQEINNTITIKEAKNINDDMLRQPKEIIKKESSNNKQSKDAAATGQ